MFCCHEDVAKKIHEELDVKTQETENGIRVDVTTKDPKKTDAFKQLVKLHKVFFKDCCK